MIFDYHIYRFFYFSSFHMGSYILLLKSLIKYDMAMRYPKKIYIFYIIYYDVQISIL